ncbi:hypothetical protein EBZ38_14480 [bacterium]|nr:hypothetical protein [bacterium]NDD85465.1 hypothetical protein [bacterium]
MTEANKDFIFHPNPSKPNNVNRKETYYCVLGEHDYLDQDNNPRLTKETSKTLAKIIETSLSTKFFIKVGTYGRIYNPIGMYSEGKESKFLAKIGKNEWVFKEVNKGIFDQYVTFLRTKNIAWLNNAERELL